MPFSILEIFYQNFHFLASGAPFLKKIKILSFFETFCSGHVAHVLYPIFEALFVVVVMVVVVVGGVK